MPQHLDSDALELVKAYRQTQDRLKELGELAEHLKGQIIAALNDHDTGVDERGNAVVTYRASRRFDTPSAMLELDETQRMSCLKVDVGSVKKVLGERAEAFMIPEQGPRRFVVNA